MLQDRFSVGNMGGDLEYSCANDMLGLTTEGIDHTDESAPSNQMVEIIEDITQYADVSSLFLDHIRHKSLIGRTQKICESVVQLQSTSFIDSLHSRT